MNRDEREVVITGAGILTPLGCEVAAVFEAACRGESATTAEAGLNTARFTSRVLGPLPKEADLLAGFRKDQARYVRKNSKVMCRDTILAVGSSGRAVPSAALPLGEGSEAVLPTIDHRRFGIIYGASYMPPEIEDFIATVQVSMGPDGEVDLQRWGRDGIPRMTPLWLLKFLPNMPACHMGIVWDCQGPSNSLPCNEASGLLAVGEAFRHVARGTADIMLAGGTESKVNASSVLRFALLGNAAMRFNSEPQSAHRPFDVDRDGSVAAEGAATLVVEAAEHQVAGGRKARARIKGFGSACATTRPNVPEVSGAAIARAMRAALRDAGLNPGDIDAVVAHGAAVPSQDVAEAAAIRTVLGDVPVTCFAGGMGNVGAGHGPVDLALACEMLAAGCVPPVRNCERVDPACPIRVVTGRPLEKPLARVMVLSAAIAAQCAAMIIEKV